MAAARAAAPICLKVLSDLMDGGPWLAGDAVTLADLHVAPMMNYFLLVPEGREMFERHPALVSWRRRMFDRPSMRGTQPSS